MKHFCCYLTRAIFLCLFCKLEMILEIEKFMYCIIRLPFSCNIRFRIKTRQNSNVIKNENKIKVLLLDSFRQNLRTANTDKQRQSSSGSMSMVYRYNQHTHIFFSTTFVCVHKRRKCRIKFFKNHQQYKLFDVQCFPFLFI